MKNWCLFLLNICVIGNIQAVIVDKVIMDSVPTQVQPSLNKTIYHYGVNHRNRCIIDELEAQTQKLMDLFSKAEIIPAMRYHVYIESDFAVHKHHGVLSDLLKRVKSKNFNNTSIEDVNYMRACSTAASYILGSFDPAARKRELDEKNLIEQVRGTQLFFEVLPPELQAVSIGDSSELHKKRMDCIAYFEYEHAKRYFFNKSRYPISLTSTLEAAEKLYRVLHQLRDFALATESFNLDLRTLTLQDVYNATREYITLSWLRYAELHDREDEIIFRDVLEQMASRLESHIQHFSHVVDKDKSLLDEAINLDRDARIQLDGQLEFLDTFSVDLELFYKIIMLEKKQEVEKIIIISGSAHMERLKKMLEQTGRYRCLLHEITPQLCQRIWRDHYGEINVPLKMYIFELAESPRKNLEWEILLRKWLFPLLYKLNLVK